MDMDRLRNPKSSWSQPRSGQWNAIAKDQGEASVCRNVCRGDMTLAAGQHRFLAPDWTEEYTELFLVNK